MVDQCVWYYKKVNEIQAPPNSVGMRFFNVWAEKVSRSDMLYRMLEEKQQHILQDIREIGFMY